METIEVLDRRIVVAAVHGDAPPRAEMRALQPVVRRVAKQPRQARVLIDDVVNETAFGMRGADRRAAPEPEHVPVNLVAARQDDRVLHGMAPGTAIGPAVPIISAMVGVRQSLSGALRSPAGRRRNAASA